jgi:hypothetical protein
MSYNLHLDRVTAETPYIRALRRDYSTGKNPAIFQGTTEMGETVTAFVTKKGRAFVALDHDPDGYVTFSEQLASCNGDYSKVTCNHPGVDEWEFEPGSFDPSDDSITIEGAKASLY